MQTKVYKLHKKYAAYFETKYCGVVVPMSFVMGVGSDPDQRAEMILTDKFSQDAVEADPRFNKLYTLEEVFGEEEKTEEPAVEETAVAEEPKKKSSRKGKKAEEPAKTFGNINDALYYLEEELGVDVDGADTDALFKQYNIVVE